VRQAGGEPAGDDAVFAGFMLNTWWVATIAAGVAGVVGFFVVLRGAAFVAHAIPNGAFAGAAGAALTGLDPLMGLGAFSLAGAAGIGWLSRSGRRDVATALTLAFMLGLGALFLSLSTAYAPGVYSLLFGEVLGVSAQELWPTVALAVVCLGCVAVLYRPLLLASVAEDAASARGLHPGWIEAAFLAIVALATTMTAPVVGTLLIFSLMIGPPSAARCFTARPGRALLVSLALALATVWAAVALSYTTDYPIGFFVGTIGAAVYVAGRGWQAWRS
jgi:zinc/manganese transport system permease protein